MSKLCAKWVFGFHSDVMYPLTLSIVSNLFFTSRLQGQCNGSTIGEIYEYEHEDDVPDAMIEE